MVNSKLLPVWTHSTRIPRRAYHLNNLLRKSAENHNHRPCRWFAQAPLGHVPGRAYRLIESSANRADFPGMPLKGLILFAFFYRLTCKRVNVFFDTHLVIRVILL